MDRSFDSNNILIPSKMANMLSVSCIHGSDAGIGFSNDQKINVNYAAGAKSAMFQLEPGIYLINGKLDSAVYTYPGALIRISDSPSKLVAIDNFTAMLLGPYLFRIVAPFVWFQAMPLSLLSGGVQLIRLGGGN